MVKSAVNVEHAPTEAVIGSLELRDRVGSVSDTHKARSPLIGGRSGPHESCGDGISSSAPHILRADDLYKVRSKHH
jgi:hypothetical protein